MSRVGKLCKIRDTLEEQYYYYINASSIQTFVQISVNAYKTHVKPTKSK